MPQKWLNNSELVTGLVLERRLKAELLDEQTFYPPYCDVISDIKAGKSIEELQIRHSFALIQASISASEHVNGLGDKTDWPLLLQKLSSQYIVGEMLTKKGKKMMEGNSDVDISAIRDSLTRLHDNEKIGLVQLKDIKPRKIKLIETGWESIDKFFGGITKTGVLEVCGSPSVGKSTLAAKLCGKFAKKYPNKKVVFFTLEMIDEELAQRYVEVFGCEDEIPTNIFIDARRHNVREIVSIVSGIEDIGLVIIDYAEKMIEGETTEPKMAEVFKETAFCAKQLKIPLVLLAGFSRTYQGGLPRPYHVRYTGMAEAEVWSCWALYNPCNDHFQEDKIANKTLPAIEGKAYILGWKQRGGFPVIHGIGGPRAIQVDFDGLTGWGDSGTMYALKGYS